MLCPQCASVVTDPTGKCQACGHDPSRLAEPAQPPRIEPLFGDAPAAAPSPVVQELYKAALGAKGQDYYLRQFARFDDAGRTSLTWHWPAFLSTLNWLAWRGMWSAALAFAAVCLGLGLLIFGIGRLAFDFSATTELVLLAVCVTLAFVLPGLFGNAAYYRFSKKRIEAALAASSTIDEACDTLAAQASSNRRWFVLAATNTGLLVVVGLFAWLLTAGSSFEQPAPPTAAVQPVASTPVKALAPASTSPPPTPEKAPTASTRPLADGMLAVSAIVPPSTPTSARAASTVAPAPTKPTTTTVQPSKPVGREPVDARPDAALAVPASKTAVTASAPKSPASTPAPAEFRFALQVGAFANEDNARKAQAKLQAAGFKAYSEVLETSQGKRIRVRVGPFATRGEAEQAAPLIKELDLPALLVKS